MEAEICTFSLGGYPQKVLIEGRSQELPVVITLHGGPGTPIPFSVGCRGLFPEFTSPDYTMKDVKAIVINGYRKNTSL